MYTPAFSRLLVYLSVLVLAASASAKPTRITKSRLPGSVAKRATHGDAPLKQQTIRRAASHRLVRRQAPSPISLNAIVPQGAVAAARSGPVTPSVQGSTDLGTQPDSQSLTLGTTGASSSSDTPLDVTAIFGGLPSSNILGGSTTGNTGASSSDALSGLGVTLGNAVSRVAVGSNGAPTGSGSVAVGAPSSQQDAAATNGDGINLSLTGVSNTDSASTTGGNTLVAVNTPTAAGNSGSSSVSDNSVLGDLTPIDPTVAGTLLSNSVSGGRVLFNLVDPVPAALTAVGNSGSSTVSDGSGLVNLGGPTPAALTAAGISGVNPVSADGTSVNVQVPPAAGDSPVTVDTSSNPTAPGTSGSATTDGTSISIGAPAAGGTSPLTVGSATDPSTTSGGVVTVDGVLPGSSSAGGVSNSGLNPQDLTAASAGTIGNLLSGTTIVPGTLNVLGVTADAQTSGPAAVPIAQQQGSSGTQDLTASVAGTAGNLLTGNSGLPGASNILGLAADSQGTGSTVTITPQQGSVGTQASGQSTVGQVLSGTSGLPAASNILGVTADSQGTGNTVTIAPQQGSSGTQDLTASVAGTAGNLLTGSSGLPGTSNILGATVDSQGTGNTVTIAPQQGSSGTQDLTASVAGTAGNLLTGSSGLPGTSNILGATADSQGTGNTITIAPQQGSAGTQASGQSTVGQVLTGTSGLPGTLSGLEVTADAQADDNGNNLPVPQRRDTPQDTVDDLLTRTAAGLDILGLAVEAPTSGTSRTRITVPARYNFRFT